MQVPTEVSFHNCTASDEIHAEVAKQVKRLEKFSPRITSCHIAVNGPETRHRHGDLFTVKLRIALPEHKDVIVTRTHGDSPEREHALVAIRSAFHAAQRQIEDAMRDMRGAVKSHTPAESHGHVAKFLAGSDCGFIETADGREVYFHRNSVLDGAFDRLAVGAEVRFVEEEGREGSQASTVRLVGKHHVLS